MSGRARCRVDPAPPMTPRSTRAASQMPPGGSPARQQAQEATRPFPGRSVALEGHIRHQDTTGTPPGPHRDPTDRNPAPAGRCA